MASSSSNGLLCGALLAARLGGASALLLFLPACPEQTEQPSGPRQDATCPKDFPAGCKVLKDTGDPAKNTVEYHVLVPADTKHDPAQKLLEALYLHLMTRKDTEPAGLAGYLYTSEAQFSTPPLSPVASIVKKPGVLAPAFDNKIPLELWQQVEQTLNLSKRLDRKHKRQLTYKADPALGKVSLELPFTEGATEEWANQISFAQVMNNFTDMATALFDNIGDVKELVFVATWKDQEMARIDIARSDYLKMQLHEVEEKIGSLHGRAFLELATDRGTDASVTKAHDKRLGDIYRKALAEIKGKAVISPLLK